MGFDKDNKMFCYRKDQDCIMFPSKMNAKKVGYSFKITRRRGVKGLKYNIERSL